MSFLPYLPTLLPSPPIDRERSFFCLFFCFLLQRPVRHPSLFRLSHSTHCEAFPLRALRLPPSPNLDPIYLTHLDWDQTRKLPPFVVLGTSSPLLLPFYLISYPPFITGHLLNHRHYRHHFRVSPVLNRVIPLRPSIPPATHLLLPFVGHTTFVSICSAPASLPTPQRRFSRNLHYCVRMREPPCV
ncbi:hypothetical protein LX36DRAFT_391988 [Colletotrichum falcatum]|nr:hypothetical protein LX36DRAFT_391988 [Colletotrichum falcatum]